jgi:pimeloyl-ACP methyl ester carboxylesterase
MSCRLLRRCHRISSPTLKLGLPCPKRLSSSAAVELNLEEFSPGENPILISHGLLGSISNWSSIGKRIGNKTGRRVLAVDARNHGKSPHVPEMSYDLMRQDVLKCVEEKIGEPVSLLGHSLGGRTYMWTALKNPEIVRDLIVVDISPVNVETEVYRTRG